MITETITQNTIENWFIDRVSEYIDIEVEEVNVCASFMDLGINSLATLNIIGELESWLGIKVNPTEFWDYPTIQLLSGFLIQRIK